MANPAAKHARYESKELDELHTLDTQVNDAADVRSGSVDPNEHEDKEEVLINITLRTLGGKILCVAAVSPDASCEALHEFATEDLGQLPGAVKIIGQDGQIPAGARISDNLNDGADVQVVFQLDQYRACENLMDAAIDGDDAKVRDLLYAGASIDAVDAAKRTVLHQASREGHLAVVKLLLEKGANANVGDNHELTPLHFAAARGHQEVTMALLEHGAHRNVRDSIRETPLSYAIMRGQEDVQKLLRSAV